MRIWKVTALAIFLPLIANAEDTRPLQDMPMPPVNMRFPVTHDALSIAQGYLHPERIDGHNVAVEGTVMGLKQYRGRLPIIKLQLQVEPEINIWVAHPTPIAPGTFLTPGNRVRVMGYLRYTDELVRSLGSEFANENRLTLMSLCIVQPQTLNGIFDQKYIELCAAWQKGLRLEPLSE